MTLGAIPVIEEAGLVPGKDIVVISIDGGQDAIDVLKQGKINCIVECTPRLGKEVMETVIRLKNGETVEKTIHPDEAVFSDEQDLTKLGPRGY
jgi:simple sugar transport system substrate-binding protein